VTLHGRRLTVHVGPFARPVRGGVRATLRPRRGRWRGLGSASFNLAADEKQMLVIGLDQAALRGLRRRGSVLRLKFSAVDFAGNRAMTTRTYGKCRGKGTRRRCTALPRSGSTLP
jgi:hypothetical protein